MRHYIPTKRPAFANRSDVPGWVYGLAPSILNMREADLLALLYALSQRLPKICGLPCGFWGHEYLAGRLGIQDVRRVRRLYHNLWKKGWLGRIRLKCYGSKFAGERNNLTLLQPASGKVSPRDFRAQVAKCTRVAVRKYLREQDSMLMP